ncbi:Diphthamide biosynthesis protein 4 [Trichoderma ghanense]|uniref:Diphthamide biosynthesis protein 4 n=1 Tax=Trichoderma ghanense TaxID=65468 RepID=A0ABY2HI21_9HYPO
MASPSSFVQLAKSLPEPLQRFFARWPPASLVAPGTPPTAFQEQRPNPFRFYKHPVTGRWQDPVYSQRRQAQLVKLAREHGVEELLPETTKGTEYRLAHRVEHGLRVKGTGVGQKVKGHIHERHMIAKFLVNPPHSMAVSSPSHYDVLNLTPSILNTQHDPSTLIKQAYRRALLRHHPDKASTCTPPSISSTSISSSSSSSQTRPSATQLYTIDQITQAFTVLSSPLQRSTYDATLRLTRANGEATQTRFQTGIENVDLDDLQFDEAEERWYRSCRCGNERGYSFDEEDLEGVEQEGVLMVGCHDCSLWLKVHFAVAEDEGEAEAGDGHMSMSNGKGPS